MSGFVNYVLTLGQAKSPSFGYASLGLSLERYGIHAVTADVPGAVKVTAAEQAGYACGDLTPSEVAAGQPLRPVVLPMPPRRYLRPQVWPGSAVTRPLRAPAGRRQVRRALGARTEVAPAARRRCRWCQRRSVALGFDASGIHRWRSAPAHLRWRTASGRRMDRPTPPVETTSRRRCGMIRRTVGSTARIALPTVLLVASSIGLSAIASSPAQATTDAATLAGEGGTFLQRWLPNW